jgi:hypothetical protein
LPISGWAHTIIANVPWAQGLIEHLRWKTTFRCTSLLEITL